MTTSRWFLLAVAVIAAAIPVQLVFASSSGGGGQEYGVWQWTPLSQMSVSEMQQVVNEAAANNFTVIYQTTDEYLAIDAMPDGPAKQKSLAAYKASVGEFLSLASAQGIAVDAEAGWRDWAQPGNTWQPYEIMSFVAAYNAAHPNGPKFRGVQYDIEPYLLPQYATNPGSVLTQYAALVEGLVKKDKQESLPLGFDLPSFYTSSVGATPEITIDGVTAYPYDQVLRLLNELPNGRILLMAYRNSANGTNGTIALSSQEIQMADSGSTKVIVGQETGPVTPSYVTFYGMTKADLAAQVALVDQAFASDSSFNGIAIDYLDYFVQLQ